MTRRSIAGFLAAALALPAIAVAQAGTATRTPGARMIVVPETDTPAEAKPAASKSHSPRR